MSQGILRRMLGAFTFMGFNKESIENIENEKPIEKFYPEKNPKEFENRMLQKGLNKFYYGDNFLFALNQKNADRKARKKGWI